MSLPADLQRLWDDIELADRTADALAARVSEEEFFWQPDEGRRWSIAQCLDHLATSVAVYGGAVRQGIDAARARGWQRRGPATPGFFGRLFVSALEPPPKRKTKAPGKIQPRLTGTRGEIMHAYHVAHDEVRRMITDAADIDTNRATFANPFFGFVRVRVSTGLNVLTAHERRHLWQAEQVEKELRSRGGR